MAIELLDIILMLLHETALHVRAGWRRKKSIRGIAILECVCKELGGATVGSANSALSYSEFLPLKSETVC